MYQMTKTEKTKIKKDAEGLWQAGWYAPARFVQSPNFSSRPEGFVPELVVIHSISLPPGEYENGEIETFFLNELNWDAHPYYQQIRGSQVSAHFVIARSGQLTQYVSCDQKAWHAGRSSWLGRNECNEWSIGIELEGLEGQTFEDAQYATLAALLNAVCDAYPIVGVAGHEHVAPTRKIDPGAGFDWKRLLHMTDLSEKAFPRQVIAISK